MCGPRHVIEEAAKRDKESLDGKPIDEQLAGVASLGLLYYVTQAEVQSHRRHVMRAERRNGTRPMRPCDVRAGLKATRRKAAADARRAAERERRYRRAVEEQDEEAARTVFDEAFQEAMAAAKAEAAAIALSLIHI